MKETIRGTMAYYREVEDYNTKLRSQLLARTEKLPNETASEWVTRVYGLYQEQKRE